MSRTDYKNLVDELQTAIQRDQIFVVRDLLLQTDQGVKKNSVVQKFYDDNAETLDKIRRNISQIDELLESLRSEQGWTKCAQKKGITVYFQKIEGSNSLETKMETFFPAETHELTYLFTKLISLFNETDLLPKWFPRGVMKSCDMDQQVTKFSKVVTSKVTMPIPANLVIGPRETTLWAQGFDMSERSQVVVTVNSVTEGEVINGVPTPPLSKGYSQFLYQAAFFFELKPTGIVLKIINRIDLCSKMIPPMVMNMIAKGVIPFEMIYNLKKQVDNFEGSLWEKRVSDNPHIYNEIEDRLNSYLKVHFGAVHRPLTDEKGDDAETNWETQSARISISNSKRRLTGFKSISSRLSAGRSAKKSKSGKKFSKDARRSYANLNKVELYDFEHKTDRERVAESQRRENSNVAKPPPDHQFAALVSFVMLYLVTVIAKIFEAAGQKNLLLKFRPQLTLEFPQIFQEE